MSTEGFNSSDVHDTASGHFAVVLIVAARNDKLHKPTFNDQSQDWSMRVIYAVQAVATVKDATLKPKCICKLVGM